MTKTERRDLLDSKKPGNVRHHDAKRIAEDAGLFPIYGELTATLVVDSYCTGKAVTEPPAVVRSAIDRVLEGLK